MKNLVSLKWIFCLLGSAMFFACSEDQEEIVGKNNLIDDIQITNGMLVFPSHKVLESVINGEKSSYTNFVSQFYSQQKMFENVVAAESKQMDYLDSLSGEILEKAPKHTSLYETALKEGLIKEVSYSDGTSSYDYNLAVPYYSSVINKEGFFAVQDTLYQVTNDYVKYWANADIKETDVLARAMTSDEEKNIVVFDYKKGENFIVGNANPLSRFSFPAPPSQIEKGAVENIKAITWGDVVLYDGRLAVTFIDKIGLALTNYTRDLYIRVTSQKKINGTNSYGYSDCGYTLDFTMRTETDGIISDTIRMEATGIGSNVYYTFYPAFYMLLEQKTQQVTNDPYTYFLYARFDCVARMADKNGNDLNGYVAFSMSRLSKNNVFGYKIESNDDTIWLNSTIE